MVRILKPKKTASRRSLAAARLYAPPKSPIVLEVPDKDILGSPCPSPSRKRKRTVLESAIRIVPECPATPATVELREDDLIADGIKRPLNRTDSTEPVSGSDLDSTTAETETSWRYFSLNICSCMDAHAVHTHALPITAVRKWQDLESALSNIAGVDYATGIFTDLEGNELYELSTLFEQFIECGLSGVIWHEAYFADVEMGNRRLAQQRVKECLAMQRQSCMISRSVKTAISTPRHSAASSQSLQITPPPPRVTVERSPSVEPWTAHTSSSGRITELQSCNKSSTIKSQVSENIFAQDESYAWPMTPMPTSDAIN